MKSMIGFWLAVIAMLLVGAYIAQFQFVEPVRTTYRQKLSVGWESQYPYHYVQGEGELARRTGLDTELVTRTLGKLGYRVEFVEGEWRELTDKLARGEVDVVSLAAQTPERKRQFLYSDDYLDLHYAAFYRLNSQVQPPSHPDRLHEFCVQHQLRIGTVKDYAYPPPIQAILDDPNLKPYQVEVPDELDNLENVVQGAVDLVFVDELMGSSLLIRNGWGDDVGRIHLDLPAYPVHYAFNRRIDPKVVDALNQTILQMEGNGETAGLVRSYFYPSLLALLTESTFFREIGVLAAGFAAISGIFIAYREKLNLLGAFVLAAAPAAGGGLMRDLVAGRRPVGVVADPLTLVVVAWLVLGFYLFFKVLQRFPGPFKERIDSIDLDHNPVLVFFDALGLAAYTVIGVLVAMQTRCEPLWLWGPILAAASNGGGGLLRDLVRGHYPIPMFTRFYTQIAVIWGAVLSWFFIWYSSYPPHEISVISGALLITMLGVVLTRYLTVRYEHRL